MENRYELLFSNALSWIWEHAWDKEHYASVCKGYLGMTREEFEAEMRECEIDISYDEV